MVYAFFMDETGVFLNSPSRNQAVSSQRGQWNVTDVKKIIIVNWYKIQKFGRLYQNPSQCSNPLIQNLDSWEFILVNYWKDNRSSVLRGLLLHFL